MIADGLITCTDAPIADVERAIREWRASRAAAQRAAAIAELEAPVLALWETMTPLADGRRAHPDGQAFYLRPRPGDGARFLRRDGWAPGARVVAHGGRVAHIVSARSECACGFTFHDGWSKPAPAGMPLCRAHRTNTTPKGAEVSDG